MEGVANINGQNFALSEAQVPILDRGLLYGDGVFEGVRFFDRKVLLHTEHMERLKRSAEYIRITPPSVQEYESAVASAIEASGFVDGYLRIILTRGVGKMGITPTGDTKPNFYVIVTTIALYDESFYQKGVTLFTSKTKRIHKESFSGQVKSLAYLPNIMSLWEAVDAGAQESLMLDCNGFVSEASVANIFAIRGDSLITPSTEANCLEGVTRRKIMELAKESGFSVLEGLFTLEDFLSADEVFLTGTGAGIMPVARIDNTNIKSNGMGSQTAKLRELYESRIRSYCTQLQSAPTC